MKPLGMGIRCLAASASGPRTDQHHRDLAHTGLGAGCTKLSAAALRAGEKCLLTSPFIGLSLQPACLPSRLERPSTPEASAASLPPLLLRLLPGGANQFPDGTFPLWTSAFHGARKYLNNVVEQDHRVPKKRVWLARGYQSFSTAWRTLQGIEALHMIRKGRARWVSKGDPLAQLQFIDGLFGLSI
jgi:hypothetical protein